MAMTIAVTRNTPGRFDGFLASCMQEIAPGVYVAPTMKKAVRERVWAVMMEWESLLPDDAGVVLFWRNPDAPSKLDIRLLGWPKKEFLEHEGLWLTHRDLTEAHTLEELMELIDHEEAPLDEDDPMLLVPPPVDPDADS